MDNNTMGNGQAVNTEYPVNYKFWMMGHLGHDNKLFDRTCPNCKGMYSSVQYVSCPKCGAQLTYITSVSGTPMSISEGTIYPSFGPKQKKRDEESVANRKNGMPCVYRFKMFSFADDNGVLSPPTNHHLMKSGALVKVTIVNHQVIHSGFVSKDGQPRVEVMMMIYPQYGDSVEYLAAPKVNQQTTAINVDANGNPAPVNVQTLESQIDALRRELEALKAGRQVDENLLTETNPQESTARVAVGPFDAAA